MGYILPISSKTRTSHVSKVPLNAKIEVIGRTNKAKISYRSHPKFVRKEFPKSFGQFIDTKV